MKRLCFGLILCALISVCSPVALAYDYTFSGASDNDFYGSTNYEDIYGAAYEYGGTNLIDFMIPTIAYGYQSSSSTVQTTTTYNSTVSIAPTYSDATIYPDLWSDVYTPTVSYTSAASLTQSDGSIGTLSIPTLGIYMKVYDGETLDNMNKGVAHFSDTSSWYGNIGLCGHNRGATYVIGDIKDLELGDIIQYTTSLGTRTYAVSLVTTISETNWSYLNATSDNRITLITCVENQSELRWCIQAVEIT